MDNRSMLKVSSHVAVVLQNENVPEIVARAIVKDMSSPQSNLHLRAGAALAGDFIQSFTAGLLKNSLQRTEENGNPDSPLIRNNPFYTLKEINDRLKMLQAYNAGKVSIQHFLHSDHQAFVERSAQWLQNRYTKLAHYEKTLKDNFLRLYPTQTLLPDDKTIQTRLINDIPLLKQMAYRLKYNESTTIPANIVVNSSLVFDLLQLNKTDQAYWQNLFSNQHVPQPETLAKKAFKKAIEFIIAPQRWNALTGYFTSTPRGAFRALVKARITELTAIENTIVLKQKTQRKIEQYGKMETASEQAIYKQIAVLETFLNKFQQRLREYEEKPNSWRLGTRLLAFLGNRAAKESLNFRKQFAEMKVTSIVKIKEALLPVMKDILNFKRNPQIEAPLQPFVSSMNNLSKTIAYRQKILTSTLRRTNQAYHTEHTSMLPGLFDKTLVNLPIQTREHIMVSRHAFFRQQTERRAEQAQQHRRDMHNTRWTLCR